MEAITLYTRQMPIVAETLKAEGTARVKRAYVEKKYGALPNFPAAYAVMRDLMKERVLPEPGDESPFWLHGTAEGTGIYAADEGVLFTLSVPASECVFFDSRRWNRVLNLSYLGKDREDEAAFSRELLRLGIAHESLAFTTPFYPAVRRRITDSWRERLLLPPENIHTLQAAVWHLRREWLVSEE